MKVTPATPALHRPLSRTCFFFRIRVHWHYFICIEAERGVLWFMFPILDPRFHSASNIWIRSDRVLTIFVSIKLTGSGGSLAASASSRVCTQLSRRLLTGSSRWPITSCFEKGIKHNQYLVDLLFTPKVVLLFETRLILAYCCQLEERRGTSFDECPYYLSKLDFRVVISRRLPLHSLHETIA